MCGITGVIAFNKEGKKYIGHVSAATRALSQRGPDDSGQFTDRRVGLGHSRLSIIDTSSRGHQPMQVPEGRYVISYNGEIYNYLDLKRELISKGVKFYTETDTEVVLQLYTHEGASCLDKLNGFFAFAIYDTVDGTLFIARDRMGIKHLIYYVDQDKFLFASEMKSIIRYPIKKELDERALQSYFQLNYIPAPLTIFKNTFKLLPGHHITIDGQNTSIKQYYEVPRFEEHQYFTSYHKCQQKFESLLDTAVNDRLVSDVPLGAFLSGGIDSSVITALASRHVDRLHTFSIGFKDEPYFDETEYARLVAKKFNTDHTVFSLSMDDMYDHLETIIDYIDEPFADSSAIPVNILSRETSRDMTVALSGDGADEIFSGYNKHSAWIRSERKTISNRLIGKLHPLVKGLPQSRSNPISNKFRQLTKYGRGVRLNHKDRYWLWACISDEKEIEKLLLNAVGKSNYDQFKTIWLKSISRYTDFNDFLRNDVELVLVNDMLAKVDLMSMANSLEVRVPFLDHRVVEFAFRMPPSFKIDGQMRKKVLQDTFRKILPAELYNRPKKGFEVPLLSWLRKGLEGDLDQHVFNKERINDQGVLNFEYITQLKSQLHSHNPGDVHAKLWAVYVFQKWYNKYFDA